MLKSARRYLLIVTLLLAAWALTWGQRWVVTERTTVESQPSTMPAAGYTYFLDVEGWYRITPYETVVRSPYDLTAGSTEAMAAALPVAVGEWQQVGPDDDISDDPAVISYLNQPTVALQRTYQDAAGQRLTLTLVGNKGADSFLLFSHTPETCYPGRLWQVITSRRESALSDGQPIYAQYLLTRHAETGEELVVLYWYLWDNPQRDSRDGVLSIRLNLFVPPGQDAQAILARAWDFFRLLFPQTVPWERF
jgi:hypothetical protein